MEAWDLLRGQKIWGLLRGQKGGSWRDKALHRSDGGGPRAHASFGYLNNCELYYCLASKVHIVIILR